MKTAIPFLFLFFCTVYLAQSQTTITLQPGAAEGKDASIWSNGPTTASGNYQSLTAYGWTNGGNPGRKRILLSFDLSQIPLDATITNAKLSLYYNPTDDIEGIDVHSGDNVATIKRITSPWDEQTISWSTRPSSTTLHSVYVPKSTSGTQDYPDMDVTTLVQDMINDPNHSYGFMIKMRREAPYRMIILASSDHLDPSNHPKLEITYITEDPEKLADVVEKINLYPNPAVSSLNIEASGFYNESANIRIVNQVGQIVYSDNNFLDQNKTIDISKFPVGIYYLTIFNSNQLKTEKFVKSE